MLQQKLPSKDNGSTEPSQKFKSLIDQYFGGTFDVELKCDEAEDEPVAKSQEQFLQLSCFMSTDVRYMHSGLKSVSECLVKLYLTVSETFFRKCKRKLLKNL